MNTEVQRMVRQRVGQQAFRQAMLDYWQGACAVTGLALPQALKASHSTAWALCSDDAERLDSICLDHGARCNDSVVPPFATTASLARSWAPAQAEIEAAAIADHRVIGPMSQEKFRTFENR
jgi:hypothetical protein